jgi:DNA repair exonuclease SbcCD nuclease subunit
MKLLICGDTHLIDKAPENRIDDYAEAGMEKFQFTLHTAKELGCTLISQPGDLFDSPNPSYSLFSKVVKMIKRIHPIWFATVYGQHDLRYRNRENTALKALEVACSGNFLLECNDRFQDPVYISSAGWGEPIPEPIVGKFNILITHRMIVDEKIWEGQTDFDYANVFLMKHKFDLIVSGDNHKYFIAEHGKRLLVNCGSMMRSSINQIDHIPTLVFFDTENPEAWYNIDIPIKPVKEVFNMETVIKTQERDEKLDAFVSGLSEHKEMGLSFGDNLSAYMKENKIDKAVKSIIEEGMR